MFTTEHLQNRRGNLYDDEIFCMSTAAKGETGATRRRSAVFDVTPGGHDSRFVNGGVAERTKAPVLKTGVRQTRTAGSNPAPSANPPRFGVTSSRTPTKAHSTLMSTERTSTCLLNNRRQANMRRSVALLNKGKSFHGLAALHDLLTIFANFGRFPSHFPGHHQSNACRPKRFLILSGHIVRLRKCTPDVII